MGFLFATNDKLDAIREEARRDAYKEGWDEAKATYADRLEANDKAIKSKNKQIKNLQEDLQEQESDYERKISSLETKIEVLEEDRDEVRDVLKKEIEVNDRESAVIALKEGLDKKAAKIKERESQLDSEEESNFKKGYADGIADGLRKISEITAKDREDAMKIAMVSAASHTPTANLKELNSVHQITAGSTDSEG